MPTGTRSIRASRWGRWFWSSRSHMLGRAVVGDTYLGLFDFEQEAALAYNVAAREMYGEFACLNEIEAE